MKSVQCRACGRPIVFLPTAGGRSIPVNVETVLPGETVFVAGKHISHFADCPAAEQFRKKREKKDTDQPVLFEEEG